MMYSKHFGTLWLASIVTVFSLLALASPPAPTYALPVRDTPTPTRARERDRDSKPVGAHIELHAPGSPAGAWAVVQWQDSAGGWHDVEGWQGTLGEGGNQRWWVAARDFGKGPFRWVVSQGQGGPALGVSQPFNLPGEANQVVPVTVSLGK
jgi:hypothetical protein